MTALSPSTLTQTALQVRAMGATGIPDDRTDDAAPTFPCALLPPKSNTVPNQDTSPRSGVPSSGFWWKPEAMYQTAPAIRAGDRVKVDGVVYEIISQPRAMRAGPNVEGYHADALSLSDLYPAVGAIQELGGADVAVLVPLAVWQGTALDRATGRASFYDPQAEAPVEFYEHFVELNRQIAVGDKTYKIQAATVNTKGWFTSVSLTRERR